MAQSKWVWVSWQKKGQSSYNGKTHKILQDTLVDTLLDPPSKLTEGLKVICALAEWQAKVLECSHCAIT